MAFVIGAVFTMIPSGFLADRFSSRAVILYSTLVGMVLFYVFLMVPQLSTIYLLPLLFASGASLAIAQPLSVALGNILGKKNPGMASAFTMGLVWCVSETVGPAGAGLLSKVFSSDGPAKALMVLGCLLILMLYAVYRLPAKDAEPLLEQA